MAGQWKDIAKEVRRAAAINRIARNVAWEQVSNARPTDLSRVPPSSEALTVEYLTAVLCEGYPGAKVTSVTLGAASSGSADRCAISVTYNSAGNQANLPTRLFHKCTKSFYTRLHLLRCENSANEIQFFNTIAPELDFELPTSYRAELEPRSQRSSLILEDISNSKGATFFTVGTPFLRSDIEGMLSILGSLHAKYWESPRLNSEFKWLLYPSQFNKILEEGMELEQLMGSGFERAKSVIPAQVADRKEQVWSAHRRAMEMSSRAPLTFLHGDPHLRNYYKTAAGVIGLADWQVTMKGAWSHDFDYTVITSLSIDQRRAWEKDLLAFYLKSLKSGGADSLAYEEAWEIYRRQTLYTFVGWLVTIGFGALQPNMQPASESLEIIRRAAAAVDDLATLSLWKE